MRGLQPLRSVLWIGPVLLVGLLGFVGLVQWSRSDDTSLYVRNNSGEQWYLAVDKVDVRHEYRFVVEVESGANAFALSWRGGWPEDVRVLAADCSEVGTFGSSSDGSLGVEGIPGLVGRVENHGPPRVSMEGTGVTPTEDCGGTVLR